MDTETFHIRRAGHGDIEDMLLLLEALFNMEKDFLFHPDNCRIGLELLLKEKSSRILVAESAGSVVGMCSGQQNISTASGGVSLLVEDVVVSQQFRKRGIATAMLTALEEWGRANDCKRVQLLADKTNNDALNFYAERGWQSTRMVCLKKML